jgi:type IV pilus assembly protein PilM
MAVPARIVALNLGSQTIGLAQFFAQPEGGLVLNGYQLREITPDLTNEGTRNAQIASLLREMSHALAIPRGAVNYAIAAQSVFTRFVKLPAVEEEKIERIIAFEAQQNVPFPIEEVVWDYQLVGGGAEEQIQVVLVAVKADLLEAINKAVESSGLLTNIVGIATMALYNAFRYNHPSLDGCSLLIDLGARTTNVIFIETGKIYSRSIAIGGASISAALAKEFNEPISAAEFRKRRDAFVSLGFALSEHEDPDLTRVTKIVRTTMTRLHAELARSISHYRSQQQGRPPQRAFLCGGNASTPYMLEFFQEKLQLPVELFHPLRNVAVTEAVDATEAARASHLLGELVGLALRSVARCPMELNLRPASVVARQQIERRRPFFTVAAACLLLAFFGWGFYFLRAAQLQRSACERLEEKIDAMRRIETQMAAVRKQTTALDHASGPLVAAINDRSFWMQLIEDINSRLPKEDIWVTELVATAAGKPLGPAISTGGRVEPTPAPIAATPAPGRAGVSPNELSIDGLLVRGLYMFNPRQQEVVVDFFKNLIGSPFLNIDPRNQAKYLKPSTPTNAEWAFPYELRLDLKTPVKLP